MTSKFSVTLEPNSVFSNHKSYCDLWKLMCLLTYSNNCLYCFHTFSCEIWFVITKNRIRTLVCTNKSYNFCTKNEKKNDSNSNQIRRSNGNIFSRYVLCYLKLVGNHMKWNQRLFHYKCIAINRNGAIPSLYISVYLVYACRLSIYNSAEGNFFWPTNEDIVVCQFKNWIWWL